MTEKFRVSPKTFDHVRRFFSSAAARLAALPLAALCAAASCKLDVPAHDDEPLEGTVGLELSIVNGSSSALTLAPGKKWHVNQLRLQVSQAKLAAPDVIDWLSHQTDFSVLDWSGIEKVETTWTKSSSTGTFQEVRGYLEAAWMHSHPTFTLELLDADNQVVSGPVMLTDGDFVLARQTAMDWADDEPKAGDYGANASAYPDVEVTSGGSFTGAADDVYSIVVTTAGTMDGGAKVSVSSARGDAGAKAGTSVTSGSAIPLGSAGSGATLTFTDNAGGTKLFANDRWFVRCFAAQGDTPSRIDPPVPGTRASFSAMAEIRYAVAKSSAPIFTIADSATQLRVTWSANPDKPYLIPVQFEPQPAYDYGLDVRLSLIPPVNGKFYVPGETVTVSVDMLDGSGHRLHEQGFLPTYRQFVTGTSNGIQYYRLEPFSIPAGHGYFNEAREDIMLGAVAGPKHKVTQSYTLGEPSEFFRHEVYLPDLGSVVFAGFADPTAWDTPVPNSFSVSLPHDAPPGTYIAAVKTARSYLGETTYKLAVRDFQVGIETITDFDKHVGNCELCHLYDGSLDRLRHGVKQSPELCVICHGRPYGVLAEHLHPIHFFSRKFLPQKDSSCGLCHLRPDSNTRSSVAVCGSCHGEVHDPESHLEMDEASRYDACGSACHNALPRSHLVFSVR